MCNEIIKEYNARWQHILKLEKENKQLKRKIKYEDGNVEALDGILHTMEMENDDLKQRIGELLNESKEESEK